EYPWQFSYCFRRRPRAPLVLAAHNVEADSRASYAAAAVFCVNGTFWHNRLLQIERFAVARADLVLAVSHDDRERFIAGYDVEPERVVVIPNGADTSP